MLRRTWNWAHVALIVAVLLSLSVVSAQDQPKPEPVGLRPDAPPYALHGPYWVGLMTITLEDAERPLTGHVWYPALNPDDLPETFAYPLGLEGLVPPEVDVTDGHAMMDAPPDMTHGPYPLVVVSHAFATPYVWMARLLEHLASEGFVVMAVNHAGNTARDMVPINTAAQAMPFIDEAMDQVVMRVQDMSSLIDAAEAMTATDGMLAGMIDLDHIAAMGPSFGGYTSLALGGAQINLGGLLPVCQRFDLLLSTQMQGNCRRYEDAAAMDEWQTHIAALADVEPDENGYLPTLRDERVDAIVPIVPGPLVFGDQGLNSIDVPILILTALGDTVVDPPRSGSIVWDGVSSANKIMVGFEDAEHGIAFYCGPAWEQALPGICTDPVWDKDRAHDLINHFTTAFLLDVLKGDKDAHAALAPDAVSFPGIEYQADGF